MAFPRILRSRHRAVGVDPPAHTPATQQDAQEVKVEQAFLAMPKITRAIFIARRFHDLSIAEICHQTGLSHKQVMRHLLRAVVHLHDALGNG